MRAACLITLACVVGCGGSPAPHETAPHETTPDEARADPPPEDPPLEAPIFAGHGAVMLRSESARDEPPLYAELAASGAITGTRCSASRLTDDGVLERDGTPIARIVAERGGLSVQLPDGTPIGWRIVGQALSTSGTTGFVATGSGQITAPGDPELPSVAFTPPSEHTLALALFAALMVCDDVGP